jgi:DNA processing protein
MDIIALRCEFPIYKISGMLLNMELRSDSAFAWKII